MQSLAVKKAAIGKLPAAPANMPADDQRSLDQLLNFIQDGPAGRCHAKAAMHLRVGWCRAAGILGHPRLRS